MIGDILSKYSFDPLTLEEAKHFPSFMHRYDVKFIVPMVKLDLLLEHLSSNYRVLVVEGSMLQEYRNDYYDTTDYTFAKDHFRGKRLRFKIRKRCYLSSNDAFWERKTKIVKGEIQKKRVKIKGNSFSDIPEEFCTPFTSSELSCSLENKYFRISFYSHQRTEKITLDIGLKIRIEEDWFPLLEDNMIIEIKGEKNRTDFSQYLKSQKIYPLKLSKYCVGIGSKHPEIYPHKLKEVLNYIKRAR